MGMFLNKGPKLFAHSLKKGVLFSATVTFHLPITGLKKILFNSFNLSIKNKGFHKLKTIMPKMIEIIIDIIFFGKFIFVKYSFSEIFVFQIIWWMIKTKNKN